MQRPGQSRDDIVRRSAGLPAAFVALFTAEPTGHPKTLLYTGMRELLRVAGDDSQQEPWARVHAINTLRLTFSDRNLANDVSGFFAEGLQVAIVAMGGGAWKVRNAASLIFTALLIRMLGFRNLVKGESARRAITGAEFFNRYPSLHHFLLTQLKAATHQLEQGAAVVHPSLTPVLALLSRLRPSLHNQSTSADDPLSPALFTEAVQSCATASQMAVRHLAAAALAPLTPPEELAPTLLRLLATATASPAPNLNVVHGCLSQAKVLLEINAQAVDSASLLNSVVQALQSSTHLMQLTAPCAPIRNEATLLAAAALALPGAPEMPSMVAYAQQIRKNCWQSILYSSAEISEPFSRLQDSTLPSGFQDSGERQPSEANDPSLEGQVKVGDRQPAKVQGPNLDAHNDSVPLSSSHHAQTPMEHASILAQSAGVQQPNKPSQYSCSQSVHSDAADPLMSLWLKNVTLLFFGHDLQKHLLGGMSSNNEGTQCSLSEDEVQVALKSGNYDVRAACLKALVRRNAAGEALPVWLPVLLKQHLLSESHHKVLRRLLQLLAALPTAANSTCHNDNALSSPAAASPSAAGQTSPKPATASVVTAATQKAHDCNKHAVHAERAMREYEQIHRLVTTTWHPSVRREGLQCLGAALQPVTAILTDMARTQQRPAEPQASKSQPIRQDSHQAQGPVQFQMPPKSSASGQHQAQLSGLGCDQIRSSRLELRQVRGSDDDPAQPANPAPPSNEPSDASGPAGSGGAVEQVLHEVVDGFTSLVSRSSHAQQFDDIRLAAAVALEASGLLSCQAHMHQPWQGSSRLTVPALQAWVIVVTMMEDEDSEVRAAASGAAGAALQALGDEGVSYGAHVELVLRHAFDLLGSCCLHLPVMQQHMLDLLYRPQSSRLFKASTSKQHNHECSSAAAASPKQPQTQPQGPPIPAEGTANGGEPQPDGDMPAKGCQLDPGLVRRLFDKELDNQHEEPLLLAQLVAHQLRLALQTDADHDLTQRVVVWANAAEQDLLGMTQSIAQLQKHETLFGGVANHGDVLQPVYCMLLALHTAGQSPHVKARLPSVLGSVQTAAAELSDVAYQPLIAAMLKTTLAVWPEPEVHDSSEELISQHGHSWSYTFLTGKQDALKGKQEGAPCRTQI
ncbi:TPA: hypothetical protein ACH3X2_008451 [Trebouxia sp. C0005]